MASVDVGGRTDSDAERPDSEHVTGQPLNLDASAPLAPLGDGWDSEPVALDWFGQGRADLLVSSGGGPHGRSARLYRRLEPTDDQPARYDDGTPIESLDGLRQFCPLPNGQASRFDLVALAPEGLVWLPNGGTAEAPDFGPRHALDLPADLGIGPGRVAQMVAEDWDGDGTIDLLVGYDDLDGYWPDGEGVPTSQQIGFNQQAGHPGYDRQGAWRGRAPQGRLFWLRNVGQPGAPRFERPEEIHDESGSTVRAPRPAPLAISWGGGRAWELLLTDASGTVRIHRNFGGQRPPVLMEPRTVRWDGQPLVLPDDRRSVVAVDLDGDHKAELLYGVADGRVFAIHSGPGRDEATAPEVLRGECRTLWFGGHAVVAAADLDADGDIDLIAGDAAGRLLLAEDVGGPDDHRYALPVELNALGDSVPARPRSRWRPGRAGRAKAGLHLPGDRGLEGQRPARPDRRRRGG